MGSKCDKGQRVQYNNDQQVIGPSHQTKDRAGHDAVRDTAAAGEPECLSLCKGQPI